MKLDDSGRRRFLQAGGAAALAAVAGCSDLTGNGGDGGNGGGLPEYERYLSVGDEEVFFAYADFQGLEEFDDGEESSGDGGNIEDIDEPLLAAPLGGIFLLAFSAGFTLAPAGLDGLINTQGESELESQGNEVLLVNGTTVVTGDLDTEEIGGRLTEEPEDAMFATQYEESGELGDYALYTPVEGESSVFAVGESELLAAQEQSGIESVVDATGGDGRAADEFDEFSWLLETAGDGLVVFGGYGPDGFEGPEGSGDGSGGGTQSPEQQLEELGNANGVVSSLGFSDDTVDATLAASFDELDDSQRDEIETEFESDRTDVSLSFDGGRLTAEATYEQDTLQDAGAGTSQ